VSFRRLHLLALGALTLIGASCDGRKGFSSKGFGLADATVLEFNLSKGVSERGASTLFGPLPDTSYADLLAQLRQVDANETKGIFIRLGTANLSLAHAEELGRRFKSLRDQNVTVTCHADDLDNSTLFFFARACSNIWVTPTGGVDSVGIAFQLMFAKSLLDKLGVGVDFLQVGKFKGAQEPYTRDEPSPEARQSVEEALSNVRAAWISGLEEGRGAAATAHVEDGPHTAVKAKELGLIDSIGYLDEARKSALDAASASDTRLAFGGAPNQKNNDFGDILRALSGADGMGTPHVAVVRAVGAITMAGGGGIGGGGDGITEAALGKVITSLTEDDDVKAVVLRIDSPGGSALASDLLWHKLMLLRDKKPLVISVGGMAASGGYYLSCAGSRIFAEPSSILGSIGVVGGKFSLGNTLSQVGVHVVTIPASPDPVKAKRAAYLSPFDRWDEPTRAKVREGMESIYDTFIDRVSTGRGLSPEEVQKGAEGRIFGGKRAVELKLVDELGGLEEAISYALEQAELGKDGTVRIRGEAGGFAELLAGDAEAESKVVQQAALQLDPSQKLLEAFPLEVRSWVGAAMPMATGESAVLLTPFAIVVH
jgi:protease-4